MRKSLGQCACSFCGETGNIGHRRDLEKPRLLCQNSYSDMAEHARS